ncbi:hypothetical protein GCM10028805_56260 [Spirosoma harenae]
MSVIKPAIQYPEQIAYFTGANNYCWLHFRNGEKKLLAKPISYLEEQLPDFVRVHKTVLVNPTSVTSLHQPPRKKMAGEVRLTSGECFPVSRRRWSLVVESLLPYLNQTDCQGVQPDAVAAIQSVVTEVRPPSPNVIVLITNDQATKQQTEQVFRSKWPAYQLYTTSLSAPLLDVLRPLPKAEQPTFILVDARTAIRERLATLHHLKQDPRLKQIPVILLVSPTETSVIEGYQHQVNSVITIPPGDQLFGQTIERIGRFWLHLAALPKVVR